MTGFHKRKVARRKEAADRRAQQEKDAKREARAEARQQEEPLAVAVSKLLDDPISVFGTFRDQCTGSAWCSRGKCIV